MAQNNRLEMMENTFGRPLAADLAMTDFFEAVFNRKSEKLLDRLAKKRRSKEFTDDDMLRAMGDPP